MSSEMNDLVIISFFGNGYVTLLDAEIKDYIYKRKKVTREEFISILQERGYHIKDIMEEIDRQCYASTLRVVPSENAYVSVDIGRRLWVDILQRIRYQPSMLGGKLQRTDSGIKLDIYRTDFQSLTFKKMVNRLGLRQAPVMRWTKQVGTEDALNCLDQLINVVPFVVEHKTADRSFVLQTIQKVNKHKSKKTTWAWMITHPMTQLKLTPSRKSVIETLFLLSKGPVDWKGNLVSFDDLKMHTDLFRGKIEESIEYLEKQGILRKVNDGLTPTGQGYVLLRYALSPRHSVTFAVARVSEKLYQLEVSAPRFPGFNITDLLKECGGTGSSEFDTPLVFSACERSDIIYLIDKIIRSGLK